jgi:hypothetical protein
MHLVCVTVLVFSSFVFGIAYATEPISYWNFDENLNDLGITKNDLQNTNPIFLCGINNESNYCFEPTDSNLGILNFTRSLFGTAVSFNGKTYLTTGENNPKDYDFIDYDHPFTFEWWMDSSRLCYQSFYCFHQYLFSKAETNNVTSTYVGLGIGIQRNGGIFTYLQGTNSGIYAQTQDDITTADVPQKYSVVYTGNGTWDDLHFYVNGDPVEKKPLLATVSDYQITSSIKNNSTLVIGNFWYRYAQPLASGWIDEVKIYDYAKNQTAIKNDFLNDVKSSGYTYEEPIKKDSSDKIPSWAKSTMGFFASKSVYSHDLDKTLLWLVYNKVLFAGFPLTENSHNAMYTHFQTPSWFDKVFEWYYFDNITDAEMVNFLQYSLDKRIITIHHDVFLYEDLNYSDDLTQHENM